MSPSYPAQPKFGLQILSTTGSDAQVAQAISSHIISIREDIRPDDLLRAVARRGWTRSIRAWALAYLSIAVDKRCLLSGRTALQEAVSNGKKTTVELLIGMGANPLTTDHQGFTCIHDACWGVRQENTGNPEDSLWMVTLCARAACELGYTVDTWDQHDPNRPWTCAHPQWRRPLENAWIAGFMHEKTPPANADGVALIKRL